MFVNLNGSPEGFKECARRNAKHLAADDQKLALMRDWYAALSEEKQSQVDRYESARREVEHGMPFFALRVSLEAMTRSHRTKSDGLGNADALPTLSQLRKIIDTQSNEGRRD